MQARFCVPVVYVIAWAAAEERSFQIMRHERRIKGHGLSSVQLDSDGTVETWSRGATGGSASNSVMDHVIQREGLDKFMLSLFGINAAKPDVHQLVEDLHQALRKSGFEAKEIEGHIEDNGQLAKQVQQYDEWATSLKLNTICETGFNAGHSALRFLAQSNANVYEFDLGRHNYSKVAADFLNRSFPGRLNTFWGDSRREVPEFHARHPEVKCDLLIVDGGHGDDVALSDLETFGRMASENHVVAIDDTPCYVPWCNGPTNAWHKLVSDGCLVQESAVHMGNHRGFSFGHFRPCARLQEHH